MPVSMHQAIDVPVARIKPYSRNPKKPIGPKQDAALRHLMETIGFLGTMVVGLDSGSPGAPDATYVALDGNTRLQILLEQGVPTVPCYLLPGGSYSDPDFQAVRHEFVLSFDRARKVYDEKKVLEDLKELVAQGRDVKALAKISGVEKLARIVDEAAQKAAGDAQKGVEASIAAATAKMPAMESFVLYGPQDDMNQIKAMLDNVKGRLSAVEKVKVALSQALDNLDFTDECFLTVFLAALARHQAGGE